jgi:hypothetical protein
LFAGLAGLGAKPEPATNGPRAAAPAAKDRELAKAGAREQPKSRTPGRPPAPPRKKKKRSGRRR